MFHLRDATLIHSCNTSELLLSNISDHAAHRGATRASERVRVLSAPGHKSSFNEMKRCFGSRRVRQKTAE